MKNLFYLVLLLSLWDLISSSSVGMVTTSTEASKESANIDNDEVGYLGVNPKIYAMDIKTNVTNRYATTLITSKVKNMKSTPAETTFSVILPENAFISEFSMEIDGKMYKAYVKEKEEAKQIYQTAVASGQGAAHVELSARDSKTFTVSVNIEPESKTIFRLTYEELLQRQLGQYELILNIHPGQIIDDLNVEVHINESRPLTFVHTPSLRTGNEIRKNDDKLKPETNIQMINSTSAIVTFKPNINDQKNFGTLLGENKENGLAGQFVVQYDVERDPHGGEVLVRDGYFVHFFAPSELKPLQKHVVFVLDHSGSMTGRKFEQLTEAMKKILSDLHLNDLFHIVRFQGEASVWDPTQNKFNSIFINSHNYDQLEPQLRKLNLPNASNVSSENIEKAQKILSDNSYMGLTNIIAGLEVGMFLSKRTQEKYPNKYQPMIVFLTDGLPNVGLDSTNEITNIITKLNSGDNRVAIFALSFGEGADKKFLRKLSLMNLGFSTHIFEAADASLQLEEFYQKISSPLLSNVTFKYVDGVSKITKTQHSILFNGSEIVVAGKFDGSLKKIVPDDEPIIANYPSGTVTFTPVIREPVSSIERLWAYLTVKQILKERDTVNNKTNLDKKILDLALKYSFVTEVTSLVVVKPNNTKSGVDTLENKYRNLRNYPHAPFQVKSNSWIPPSTPYRGLSATLPLRRNNQPSFGLRGSPSLGWPNVYYAPWSMAAPLPHHQKPSTTVATSRTPQAPLPSWLETMKQRNETITGQDGLIYKLGDKGLNYQRPMCPKTPLKAAGECTIIFDCPTIFPLLTDINVYLEYFCPLNGIAGVCCPIPSTIN